MAIIPIEYIAMTPDICGGKPHIAGKRITVQNIAVLHVRNGWSVEQITDELELTPAQIYAALSYYHDHKDEIDQSIREADALARKIGTPIEALRKQGQS
jgi:uncharacterized protein (DUF433 family)